MAESGVCRLEVVIKFNIHNALDGNPTPID